MRADMVRYFIAAALGADIGTVRYGNQPDSPDNCVTVYAMPEESSVHYDQLKARYQAIVRNTDDTTAETNARTIYDAVKSLHNLKDYDGMYLAESMSGTTDPIEFDPDDNGGTPASTATSFSAGDYILIGTEILLVTDVTDDTVTASRAELGTTKAAHADNAEVYNISQSPVPGESCDSCRSTSGILSMGIADKQRWEFSVNWEVTLKP